MGEPTRKYDDIWSRLPGGLKVLIAIGAVWVAGWTSAIVAQEYQGVPNVLQDHELRIRALEEAREAAVDRTNRNFVYVACRLDEIAGGTSGARCNLILDDETRLLLRQLRGTVP